MMRRGRKEGHSGAVRSRENGICCICNACIGGMHVRQEAAATAAAGPRIGRRAGGNCAPRAREEEEKGNKDRAHGGGIGRQHLVAFVVLRHGLGACVDLMGSCSIAVHLPASLAAI